ncbi:MAG: hypothetical protein Ct9H300mP21_09900 [Pseudomonadota bacterium]|nr:MAG: hypothetical protein Ct9H300mP21_09900 [Pseudomonadota bacterium]
MFLKHRFLKGFEKLAEEKRQLEKELQALRSDSALAGVPELVAKAEEVEGILVLATEIEVDSADTPRETWGRQSGNNYLWRGVAGKNPLRGVPTTMKKAPCFVYFPG